MPTERKVTRPCEICGKQRGIGWPDFCEECWRTEYHPCPGCRRVLIAPGESRCMACDESDTEEHEDRMNEQ